MMAAPGCWLAVFVVLLLNRCCCCCCLDATCTIRCTSNRVAFVVPRGGGATDPVGYQILNETTVFERWRLLKTRAVRMPHHTVVDYDVVGQKGAAGAAIIFSWDSKTKTATLIREYNPGPHEILVGVAAGLVEDDKHGADYEKAARFEMEEEIHQSGGIWYSLTDVPLAMDKYATTKIQAYLVIDAESVADPRPLDAEEEIEILKSISMNEILDMIAKGEMNVIGAWASLLAFEKLRELGELE